MVADPGSFTGSAEAKYYIQNLEACLWNPSPSRLIVGAQGYGLKESRCWDELLAESVKPQTMPLVLYWNFEGSNQDRRRRILLSRKICLLNLKLVVITTPCSTTDWLIFVMQNATVVPAGSTICVNRAFGKIMGQNVTVISSGINAQSSALCTLEVLSCASHIKDFIYTGTAGFSPAVSFLPTCRRFSIYIQQIGSWVMARVHIVWYFDVMEASKVNLRSLRASAAVAKLCS